MLLGNFHMELASLRAEQECLAGISAASSALRSTGLDDCEECGQPIALARRRAMPSARRCIACQQVFEEEQKSAR